MYIASTNYEKAFANAQLSSVEVIHPSHPEAGRYMTNAIIPTQPRALTPQERIQYMTACTPPPDASVNTVLEFVTLPINLQWLIKSSKRTPPRNALNEIFDADTPVNGMQYSPGNTTSSAVINADGHHLSNGMAESINLHPGLHIDNFSRQTVADRHAKSYRRLCVNLGPGARSFVCGLTDIMSIAQTTKLDRNIIPKTEHVAQYIRAGNAIQCLWFDLAPGEGYIIPAEIYPHDGSTYRSKESSTIAMWRWPHPLGTLALR